MNDWQDEWWEQIVKTASEVENFFSEISKTAESVITETAENFCSWLEEFPSEESGELDSVLHDFVDVIITTGEELETVLDEWENFNDDDFTEMSYSEPSAHRHPACVNCLNYHGQSYNGNLLVCGIHPSGVESDNCRDWEGKL
ncbi:MAG: hypothetical protein AAFQ80_24770 [Cyanobacteria bacterium J06621_8]